MGIMVARLLALSPSLLTNPPGITHRPHICGSDVFTRITIGMYGGAHLVATQFSVHVITAVSIAAGAALCWVQAPYQPRGPITIRASIV